MKLKHLMGKHPLPACFADSLDIGRQMGKGHNITITLDFNPEEVSLWNIEERNMYKMQFRLIDGESDEETALDELVCSFAFRTIEFKDNKLHLNGKPIYLKQTLYQGYWTKGLWTAPSDELIKKDLELNTEMGYNSMRLHQIAADPRMLYWADQMGVLLWGEIANSFGSDARAKDNFIKE